MSRSIQEVAHYIVSSVGPRWPGSLVPHVKWELWHMCPRPRAGEAVSSPRPAPPRPPWPPLLWLLLGEHPGGAGGRLPGGASQRACAGRGVAWQRYYSSVHNIHRDPIVSPPRHATLSLGAESHARKESTRCPDHRYKMQHCNNYIVWFCEHHQF